MLSALITIAALIILSMLVTHPSLMMKVYSKVNDWWKRMMEKRKGLVQLLYKRIDKDNRGFNITYNELIIMLIICIMLLFVGCSNEWNGKAYVCNMNNGKEIGGVLFLPSSSELFLPSLSVAVVGESTHTALHTSPLNNITTQQIGTLPNYQHTYIPAYSTTTLPAPIYSYMQQPDISIRCNEYMASCIVYRRNNVEGNDGVRSVKNRIDEVDEVYDVDEVMCTLMCSLMVISLDVHISMSQKELSNMLVYMLDDADYIMYDDDVVLSEMMPDLYGCNVPMCDYVCGECWVGVGSFPVLKSGTMSALSSSAMHTILPNISNITSTNTLLKLNNCQHTSTYYRIKAINTIEGLHT